MEESSKLCNLCPRSCNIDRDKSRGYCGVYRKALVSRVGLHQWEEPCISYGKGSGTVFFSGCNLKCVFCQNHEISRRQKGVYLEDKDLADEFLRLQGMGAVNINLVTPTHFVPEIIKALDLIKNKLHIPVCYNCSGYENTSTLEMLNGYIDIFLPDFKYYSSSLSKCYSNAKDYFTVTSKALKKMYDICGYASFDTDGHMTRGVLTRHLVLPTHFHDSIKILEYIANEYDTSRFAISIMSQYFPTEGCSSFPEINRRLTTLEYNHVTKKAKELGFKVGFFQERSSAKNDYVPSFDYTLNKGDNK